MGGKVGSSRRIGVNFFTFFLIRILSFILKVINLILFFLSVNLGLFKSGWVYGNLASVAS